MAISRSAEPGRAVALGDSAQPAVGLAEARFMTTPNKELHFYPGAKMLLWIVAGKVALRAEAWGGEPPQPGAQYDTMAPRQTTPGRYVVHSYAPYRTKTWPMSQLTWGTPVAKGPNDTILYPAARGPAASVVLKDKTGQPVSALEVERAHFDVYGRTGFPTTWVFNDFGPWAVRYFLDKNGNRRLDRGEMLFGEMIHTTPDNEGETAQGKPVTLFESHGCIHVKPLDRDQFHRLGAFARGNTVVVHSYKASVPRAWR
jgi:hypothetical protein